MVNRWSIPPGKIMVAGHRGLGEVLLMWSWVSTKVWPDSRWGVVSPVNVFSRLVLVVP